MSRTFKFTLRVKGCEKEFAEGMGPGVLVTQEVVYKTAPKKAGMLFVKALLDQADVILKDNVEVTYEEINEESPHE
jgi:hypothetical protein